MKENRMAKMILTIGLIASGKSTWAREQIEKNKETYINVNLDDLREMCFNYHFSGANEKFVVKIQDNIIREALSLNKTVIISNMNLNSKVKNKLKLIADQFNADFQIIEFPIKLSEAIKRDILRGTKPGQRSIGSEVITEKYIRYIKGTHLDIG